MKEKVFKVRDYILEEFDLVKDIREGKDFFFGSDD